MNNITIAIDGFSSTGKSTVAKRLAKALGYIYVDTGAMYRAVTLHAMRQGYIGDGFLRKKELVEELKDLEISFKFNPDQGFAEVYLQGENVEKAIRTLDVSSYVSQIATISEVREQLVRQQQELGRHKGVVMDGRDIGSVVFPEAELKIFMTASAETRAQRRHLELLERGESVSYEDVLENVKSRDYIDSTRKDSPLKKTSDAIEIDNSHLSLEEQFQKLLELSKIKIAQCQKVSDS